MGTGRKTRTRARPTDPPDPRAHPRAERPTDLDSYVRMAGPDDRPPSSSLVQAFDGPDRWASDAIVLRGYLGRSDIVDQLKEFLHEAGFDKLRDEVDRRFPEDVREPFLPWRIYLSPRLDRYVDFYWKDVLAWRPEGKEDRKDAYTIWLRNRREDMLPIVYQVVQKAELGGSYAGYLGGELIDDWLSQPDSQTVAWDDQTIGYIGRRRTGTTCTG